MDASAISLARENSIPIIVFSIHAPGAFARRACAGEGRYTIIRLTEAAVEAMAGQRIIDGSRERRMDGALEALRKEFARPAHRPRLGAACSSRSWSRPTAARCRSTRSARSTCPSRACSRSRSGTAAWSTRSRRRSAKSGLGLNPAVDGQLIRVPIPELNAGAAQRAGQGRAQICRAGARRGPQRAPRRHGRAEAGSRRTASISAGRAAQESDEVQKLTDGHIKQIDEALAPEGKGDHAGLMWTAPLPVTAEPGAAAPRRDHHGRQRPLGAGARPAAHRRPSARRRGGRAGRSRAPASSAIPYLTLFAFSSENWKRPGRRGRRPDGPAAPSTCAARSPSCAATACGCASSASATGSPPTSCATDRRGRDASRATTAAST